MNRQECMDTIIVDSLNPAASLTWSRWFGEGLDLVRDSLAHAATLLYQWQERSRQRRDLRRLSDFHLKDIGISRADVEGEASKPFYRP